MIKAKYAGGEVLASTSCYCYTNQQYDIERLRAAIADSSVLDCVRPGDRVFIKPNWVQERHQTRDEWEQMITHPAVITATLDLVVERLQGNGSIILGDSPMTPADFSKIIELMPLERWRKHCEENGVAFSLVDMRNERWNTSKDGVILESFQLPGDPDGKILYNLEDRLSEFHGKKVTPGGYYGASYDTAETNRAHDGINNLYEMGASVMLSDVFVNLPKLKTHKKAGMTCCLKNLVGVSTNKNLLPHHTAGTPEIGGDQFASSGASRKAEGAMTEKAKRLARSSRIAARLLVPMKWAAKKLMGDNRSVVRNGSWYGNDTIWRTILDLNKILFYGDTKGNIGEAVARRYVAIVDGVVAGEGEGPLEPDRVEAGILICGNNPVAIDVIASKLIGFDYEKVPSIAKAFDIQELPLIDGRANSLRCSINGGPYVEIGEVPAMFRFVPPSGWTGHIEHLGVR
ncbi:DUF362 domain-containing protein [Olsenella sp. Marseille-QA0557]|uniref:DUF362 domain-containing protein n=1 Tax=Olsenella sp. Marseille-QA0557 TaxID=3378782 RepID=UPI003D0B1755